MPTDIQLKPLTLEDKEMLSRLANNKKIWNCLRDVLPHPYKRSDAETFILFTQTKEPLEIFGILWEGTLCGVIELSPQEDVYRKTGEIGYWIGEPYWGKGIGTAAVALMTHYGFETLALERIHAGVFDFNTASMRVLEKNDYVKEGVFRKAILKNGVICDEHRYAKLKEE